MNQQNIYMRIHKNIHVLELIAYDTFSTPFDEGELLGCNLPMLDVKNIPVR